MLVEYRNVRQVGGEGYRRWFSDDYFDLIVWYEGNRHSHRGISGFQLCYDRSGYERALTWQRGRGFSHEKVDTGEGGRIGPKSTPILVADGLFDASAIAGRFREASRGIDAEIVELVLDRLAAYPGG
jgi:hypothetical protein